MKRITTLLLLILPGILLLTTSCRQPAYIFNEGKIYGTIYHIVYEHPRGEDLHASIDAELARLNGIFSTFDSASQISLINTNQNVVPDSLFIQCFNRAMEISALSEGAFDITVAPMVNAWGFGFKHREKITPGLIDSLLELTGYRKVRLEEGKVVKDNPGTMLDMSAIAKGYTCDLVGEFLAARGCTNIMVEIGGEVVARGLNPQGAIWSIGISEPDETSFFGNDDIQAVVMLQEKALATSGNYRNFYEEGGKRYAHTIDPATGYPVQHSLLSATVLAGDCMTADALATAFMVMGLEKGVELSRKLPGVEVYFFYSDETGFNKVYMSEGFRKCLAPEASGEKIAGSGPQ